MMNYLRRPNRPANGQCPKDEIVGLSAGWVKRFERLILFQVSAQITAEVQSVRRDTKSRPLPCITGADGSVFCVAVSSHTND